MITLGAWPDETMARIAKAVGKDVDCAGLCAELHDFHCKFVECASLKRSKKLNRPKKIADIAKQAGALIDFLQRPQDRLLWFHVSGSVNTMTLDELATGLRELKAAAECMPADDVEVSQREWLVLQLVPIFETYYGERAGYTRDKITNKVDSRFIQFVKAVAEELRLDGKPVSISGDTISKAMDALRKRSRI